MPRKQDEELERQQYIDRINASTTFYEMLGVSNSASPTEINIAYRRIALRLDPEQNPGIKDRVKGPFSDAKGAYEILSNAKERKKYDNDLKPHQSIAQKLKEAFQNFCSAVTGFFNKHQQQRDNKQENQNAPDR